MKLFSAMLHDQAVVIAQIRVPDATTEVTQVAALLNPVDLAGTVVTGDAAHTQTETAAYICGREGDYVLTAKGNQSSLLDRIAVKLAATTSPGHHLDVDHSRSQVVHARSGPPTPRFLIAVSPRGVNAVG